MQTVLRTVFWQVKYNYKWNHCHQILTTAKAYRVYKFGFLKNKLLCKQFSSENRCSGDKGKRYDKYFYFIHQNDLYRNTTINYNLLFDTKFKREISDLLNKTILPTSSIGEKVQYLTDEELKQIMVGLISKRISHKLKVLNYLDEECAKRSLKWTVITSLYMLDGWIMVDEKFSFKGKFFIALRNLWCKQLQYCSKENLVQIIYYLGRSKQSAPSVLLDRIEKILLHHNKDITLKEWGIVCNGFFKMKTKIKSKKLLHHIATVAKEEMQNNDKYILISILKAFRHAHYFNKDFLRFVEHFVRETYKDYLVLECAHFLATFANVGWYNCEIFDCLEMQVIKKLVSAKTAQDNVICIFSSYGIRIKDIARILWSISYTGHKPKSENFFEIMISVVKEFVDTDFYDNIFYIVDCAQSLIMMGYYCDKILHKLLRKDIFQKLKLSIKRKPINQLYYIHSSVMIEAPLCKSECLSEEFEVYLPPKSTYKDARERFGIEQLITIMHRYCTEQEEFACSFVLPHIAITSICIETAIKANLKHFPNSSTQISKTSSAQKVKICMEVLDPTVCLENQQYCMTGLMISKIRQLRKLNYRIILFTPEAIMRLTEMTTDKLRLYIDELFVKLMVESLMTIK